MDRPIYQMLRGVSHRISLHMPATGGSSPFGRWSPYRLDVTELPVTDDLYRPTGAIREAQALAARSAGAAHTLMLHGGSTAGIHAMLLYGIGPGEQVILPRNAHISVLNLCALAGIEPVFAQPSYTHMGRPYTTLQAYQAAINQHPGAKAVLVVHPDYYGFLPDLAAIASSAHGAGMLVLCDEAHGATFNWRQDIPNAGACGADLFVQSAHKTLPVLTSGAWLHGGKGIDIGRLLSLLRMVQTSSPSFLTLLSLDDGRAWMDRKGQWACLRLGEDLERFCTAAQGLGYTRGQADAPPGHSCDPLRLVLNAPQGGFALADALAKRGIDMEMCDEASVVGILPLKGGRGKLRQLLRALQALSREGPSTKAPAAPIEQAPPALSAPPPLPTRVLPLSQAVFAPCQQVPLDQAEGRIAATHVGRYPPGVALVAAGEAISREMVAYLKAQPEKCLFGLPKAGTALCVTEEFVLRDSPPADPYQKGANASEHPSL